LFRQPSLSEGRLKPSAYRRLPTQSNLRSNIELEAGQASRERPSETFYGELSEEDGEDDFEVEEDVLVLLEGQSPLTSPPVERKSDHSPASPYSPESVGKNEHSPIAMNNEVRRWWGRGMQ
jgi:hypothetical protein